MVKFTCIAAVGTEGQIGADNGLPWSPVMIKGDMNFFRQVTKSRVSYSADQAVASVEDASDMANAVIMGRRTWESIPKRFRPLDGRFNIIVTTQGIEELPESSTVCSTFDSALACAKDYTTRSGGQIFVVGGAGIYESAIHHPDCIGVFLTEIAGDMKRGDVFFPLCELRASFQPVDITALGYATVKSLCANLEFDGQKLIERGFEYVFKFYSRNK